MHNRCGYYRAIDIGRNRSIVFPNRTKLRQVLKVSMAESNESLGRYCGIKTTYTQLFQTLRFSCFTCILILTTMAKDMMKKLRKSSQKEGVPLPLDLVEPKPTFSTMTPRRLVRFVSLTVLDQNLASDAQQFSQGMPLRIRSITKN